MASMAMEALRSNTMAGLQLGRIRQRLVARSSSSGSPCTETYSRLSAFRIPACSACSSGRNPLIHSISTISLSGTEGFQPRRSRLFRGQCRERNAYSAGSRQVKASQFENVLPLPVDNDVASLESLLDASPSQPNFCSPTKSEERTQRIEALIERVIFDCRFLTLMAVVGSLAGSLLCFFKGSLFVVESFIEYFQASWQGLGTSQVIFLLVEAVDVYLMGTVMLIFGMGLYELFVSTLEVPGDGCEEIRNPVCGSNLFGLFRLRERPKWLEIRSLDELKTKLGHVIVMILLVGMFEKSKKVPISSGLDLLCFSASILLSSGSLYLLSKLHSSTHR